MTYVGAVPTTGDFKLLDSITTSSTTTFNLRQGGVAVYPQSANHCIVQLNGINQVPTSSFNIVNDTIVFASSLSSDDVINQILVLGNVNDIGVPSDDTVSTAKLQSSAVTDAKISAMASSKLTGVVPTANLGSGTASSSTVLFGDQTFKTAPSGTLVPLAQIESSSDTSIVALTGFMDASTYTAYKVFFAAKSGGNGNVLQARFRDGSTILNASVYDFANISRYHNATDNESGNDENHADIYDDGSTNTAFIEFTVFPCGGIGNQGLSSCIWQSSDRKYNGNSRRPRVVVGAIQFINGTVPDGIQISNLTSNFEDYEMHAYGIKKS